MDQNNKPINEMRNLGPNDIIISNIVYMGLCKIQLYSGQSGVESRISQGITIPLYRSCSGIKVDVKERINPTLRRW
jgi:hypothetical protein